MADARTKSRAPDVYSTGQAAKLCGVSQQTIIRCFDTGRLCGYREPSSGFRRIPREALREFMEANAIATTPVDRPWRVLVVSSDDALTERLRASLAGTEGPVIEVATNAWDAGVLTARNRPHLIVLDRAQPDVPEDLLRERLREGIAAHPVRLVVVRPRKRKTANVEVITRRVREILGP